MTAVRKIKNSLQPWTKPKPQLLVQIPSGKLLIIYKSVIRAKLDYDCFFTGPAVHTHRNKLNNLQISCLRSIISALKSTPSPAIEVEMACPPYDIRCRWLAGKLLLKCLTNRDPAIFNSFLDIYSSWRYVQKSLPVLASIAHSLADTRYFIFNSYKSFFFFVIIFCFVDIYNKYINL